MKTTDLMIGDYITLAESLNDERGPLIFQVVALNCPDEGEALMLLKGEKACDEMEIDDEWSGIPITPAILEQNGFRYNELPFVQGWEQFGLTLYCGGNGYRVNCGANVALIIDSVHELQHALRLCGIEKEVEL